MPWQEVVGLETFYDKTKIACIVRSKSGNEYPAWIGPWTENVPGNIVGLIRDSSVDIEAYIEFGDRHANIVRLRILRGERYEMP